MSIQVDSGSSFVHPSKCFWIVVLLTLQAIPVLRISLSPPETDDFPYISDIQISSTNIVTSVVKDIIFSADIQIGKQSLDPTQYESLISSMVISTDSKNYDATDTKINYSPISRRNGLSVEATTESSILMENTKAETAIMSSIMLTLPINTKNIKLTETPNLTATQATAATLVHAMTPTLPTDGMDSTGIMKINSGTELMPSPSTTVSPEHDLTETMSTGTAMTGNGKTTAKTTANFATIDTMEGTTRPLLDESTVSTRFGQ